MGHSSKFVFPLPGRKQKPTPPPPTISAPLNKVQRILGTAAINIDGTGVQLNPQRVWDAQPNSGIRVALSENANGELSQRVADGGPANARTQQDRRWEEESGIFPPAVNRRPSAAGVPAPDAAADASSLRRRQSSSTIASFHDKSKHSQQTKSLPAKAQALLDIENDFAEPPQSEKLWKKSSRLDLSSLLPKHRPPKSQLPEPDLGDVSPTSAPPPIPQRADRKVRKRLTRESLREDTAGHSASLRDSAFRRGSYNHLPARANVDLHNLYDHYEQGAFAEIAEQELLDVSQSEYRPEKLSGRQLPAHPPPPPSNTRKASLSPFPSIPSRSPHPPKQPPPTANSAESKMSAPLAPSSPASTPADCASISSRHTRTSKASKRTDRSFNDIDLHQNSVLALSSDSEDDYELSSNLAVPTLSDGQASPTSSRSAVSQPNTAETPDTRTGKPVKRTSFATSPQFLPAPQPSGATQSPKITARTSSLTSKPAGKLPQTPAHLISRLSVGTTSTDGTVSHTSPQSPASLPASAARKGPKKMPSDPDFDFPAPPTSRANRTASVNRTSEQARPISSTSGDLYLQSPHRSVAYDTVSIHSSTSLGSTGLGGRRGSAASSLYDGGGGRFMAVTRQEEMLLAALRMKRARMREDILAEYGGGIERQDHRRRREATKESTATSGSISRQSSRSTMRQEPCILSGRPIHPGRVRLSASTLEEEEDVLPPPTVELSTHDLSSSDIIDFDDGIGSQSPGENGERASKASSIASQRPGSATRSSFGAVTTPAPRRSQRRDGSAGQRGSEEHSPKVQTDIIPHQILEDPAEDEDEDIPRPDSPISPSDFPAPASIGNKPQVRLSAVGYYKPNMESSGW